MPKDEWGVKRLCPTTGRRFYDLNKDPIVSPYTGEVVDLSTNTASAAKVLEKTEEKPAAEDVLEEADAVLEDDDSDIDIEDDLLDDDDDDTVNLDDIADVPADDTEG